MAPELLEPVPEGVGTLVVEVGGVRNANGTLNVSLFSSAEGFPDDSTQVFRSASSVLSEEETLVFRFERLEFGVYAVSILHDENDNGSMDTNFLGVPREGFGFSNNPRIGFGAPSFNACGFRFDTNATTLSVQVRYF